MSRRITANTKSAGSWMTTELLVRNPHRETAQTDAGCAIPSWGQTRTVSMFDDAAAARRSAHRAHSGVLGKRCQVSQTRPPLSSISRARPKGDLVKVAIAAPPAIVSSSAAAYLHWLTAPFGGVRPRRFGTLELTTRVIETGTCFCC